MVKSELPQTILDTAANFLEVEGFKLGDRVKSSHPFFSGLVCTISAFPTSDAAIVDLDGSARERIEIKYLQHLDTRQSLNLPLNTENVPAGTLLECEVISPMTRQDALVAVEEINRCANRIRQLLVDLEMRAGYAALGFKNMSQLMNSDLFFKARSTLQKELIAGRIETKYLEVSVGTFPQRHFRPLIKLKPEYYKLAIEKAAERSGNRTMTEKDVSAVVANMLMENKSFAQKGVVEAIKERPISTDRLPYSEGEIVKICRGGAELKRHLGYWGIVKNVGYTECVVHIALKCEDVRCKGDQMQKIDPAKAKLLQEVSDRIANLARCNLDPVIWAGLQTINQQEEISQIQLDFLTWAEKLYRVCPFPN